MAIGKISPVSSISPTPAVSSVTSRSKNIQNQIQAKEQNLTRLSNDSKLSMQEKEKKRQELQKEIEELNRKLELMRMEQEEEEEEAKEAEMKQKEEEILKEESLDNTSKNKSSHKNTSNTPAKSTEEENKPEDLSIKDAQKILNTNQILRNDLIETSADFDKENTVRILKSEIKLDELHGADTDSKKEELAELREKENFWIKAKYQSEEEAAQKAVQISIAG